MKPARRRIEMWALLTFLVAFSLAISACEPMVSIRIQNETDERLSIFTGKTLIGEADPGEEVVWRIEAIQPKYDIVAKDADGDAVFTTTFSRDDLKGKKTYRVVIRPAGNGAEQSDNATEKQRFITAGNPLSLTLE